MSNIVFFDGRNLAFIVKEPSYKNKKTGEIKSKLSIYEHNSGEWEMIE